MKKIIIAFGFLFAISPAIYSKEIYIDEQSQKEYLFLGSEKEDQKKWLDLKNNTVIWIDKNKLRRQSGQLTPDEFMQKIEQGGLVFYLEGDTPNWNGVFSQNSIYLNGLVGMDEELKAAINFSKNPSDGIFLLTFHSEDRQVYGVLHMRWDSEFCNFTLNDEQSIHEVYINYHGEVIKGCAFLGNKN